MIGTPYLYNLLAAATISFAVKTCLVCVETVLLRGSVETHEKVIDFCPTLPDCFPDCLSVGSEIRGMVEEGRDDVKVRGIVNLSTKRQNEK